MNYPVIQFLSIKLQKKIGSHSLALFLSDRMAFLLQLPSPLSTSRHHPLPVFTSLTKASLSHKITQTQNSIQLSKWVPNFQSKSLNFLLSGSLALALSFTGQHFCSVTLELISWLDIVTNRKLIKTVA